MRSTLSTNKTDNLTIVQVDINKLKFAEYNPRKISDSELANLVTSIREHGIPQPLIVNSNPARAFITISGHQRIRACKELGYTTVPVIFIDVDEEEEKKLNLRLNRISGEFDLDLLKNFDIETLLDTGFDDSDLGSIWNDALGVDDDEFDGEEAIKQAASTDIKPGQLFQLGQHRLICADSSDPTEVKRLAEGYQPSIFYMDPIYNIGLDYNKGIGQRSGYGGTTKDNLSIQAYAELLGKVLDNGLAVMAPDAHVFMYTDQNNIGLVQSLMSGRGLKNRRVCLWIKNGFNPTPGLAFNKAYEPVVYSTRGAPYLSKWSHNLTEILNKDIAPGNRAIDDITDLFDIWLARRDPGQEYQHPTQKPVTLHEKPLKRCSKVGDVVIDLMAGSGSTLIACEQMKRVALLGEIEPVFCQVICDRWSAITGKKAVKL
jgi:DNA modification methylase